jgi:hypothetical protein
MSRIHSPLPSGALNASQPGKDVRLGGAQYQKTLDDARKDTKMQFG